MRLSVGMKIGGGFLILLLLLVFISTRGVLVMNTTDKDMRNVEVLFDRVSLDYQIKNSFQSVTLALRGYATYGDESFLNQYQDSVTEQKI